TLSTPLYPLTHQQKRSKQPKTHRTYIKTPPQTLVSTHKNRIKTGNTEQRTREKFIKNGIKRLQTAKNTILRLNFQTHRTGFALRHTQSLLFDAK
ncbi:hypothetical protein P8H26_16420, partial [Pseudochrobactrum sp. sp1633]|uniref:hypothetical protein n=1 Tax=Pseudochrobactrum sp. sp1633 TaxID=3036706 RepID=UPI0025A570AA